MLLQLHRCTPREELEEFSTKEVLLKANSEPLQGQNVQKAQAKMAKSEANLTGILEQLNHEPEIVPKVPGDAMVTMHSARPEKLS